MIDSIAILDFGSQYSQLIARRVREVQVYCELFPWDAPAAKVQAIDPRGYILSGSPASVYAAGAPFVPAAWQVGFTPPVSRASALPTCAGVEAGRRSCASRLLTAGV